MTYMFNYTLFPPLSPPLYIGWGDYTGPYGAFADPVTGSSLGVAGAARGWERSGG